MTLPGTNDTASMSLTVSRRALIVLWAFAILSVSVLYCLNLFRGELNQDEGWYLYAARLVSQGELPYVDFAGTQGPVMPFVYAYAGGQFLVDRMGVAGGRLFTGLLGLMCVAVAACLSARIAPPRLGKIAAFITFCLAGLNVYQSSFFVTVKTYSLAGLFLALGFLFLSLAGKDRGWIMLFLSGVFVSLAAGTRVSAGAVLPVIFFGLVSESAKKTDGFSRAGWMWFAAGSAIALSAIFLPFLVKAPKALFFALYEYHAGRDPGDWKALLAYKAGFIARLVEAYFVGICLLAGLCAWLALVKRKIGVFSAAGQVRPSSSVMWSSLILVTLVHLATRFPYDDYQAMIFPLFAVAVTTFLLRVLNAEFDCADAGPAGKKGAYLLTVTLLVTLASSFCSPFNMKWFVERDRIWWPFRNESPLSNLRRAAEEVRKHAPANGQLLTQDLYLAIESGLAVPRGLELGPFSYFPGWSRGKAEECRVLNREMMLELLEKCEAPVAAFSGYGLAIKAPSVTPLTADERAELLAVVGRRYARIATIKNFGQADTSLEIFVRNESGR
jgi:hypothetical protein